MAWNNSSKKKDISKELLTELYIDNQLRKEEIAEKLGVSRQTIERRLREYEIPIRHEKYTYKSREEILSKEDFKKEYIDNNLSMKEMMTKYNMTKKQLVRLINLYDMHKPKEIENKNREKSMINKYGVKNPYSSNIIKEKIKQTNLERYGVEWYCETEHAKDANKPYKISKINKMFSERLKENNIDNELEYKNFDIKIKGKDIVLEINPSYTHNVTNKSTFGNFSRKPININYHLNKSKLAEEHGFQCIHIFDWDDKDKVINLLLPKTTLYARKCELKEVSIKDANDFLNLYHLQGSLIKQEICLGLYYNNELIELMTFGKPRYNKKYQYELLRLCTHKDYKVTGGTQRLFKYFVDNFKPESIISYCDISKFSGEVYDKLGFTLKSTSKPARHWYNMKTGQHITDNLLRQRGFDQLFGTNYGKGTSNDLLMLEHNFVEIYDCGQATYTWNKKDFN